MRDPTDGEPVARSSPAPRGNVYRSASYPPAPVGRARPQPPTVSPAIRPGAAVRHGRPTHPTHPTRPTRPAALAGAGRARKRRRPPGRWTRFVLVAAAVIAVIIGGDGVLLAARAAAQRTSATGSWLPVSAAPTSAAPTSAAPSPSASPTATGPLLTYRPINISVDGFFSWALLDRDTGTIRGSANEATGTSTTESMIKAWIASDYLRIKAAQGLTPSTARLDELTRMIRDSDDQAAEDIYDLDGYDAVVDRMISMCGLRDTTVVDGWWSKTGITAADATRLGLCVANGTAAGPRWTPWILEQMRLVRGQGRFGIIDALPPAVAATTAIKNGWTLIYAEGEWHVACLAIQTQWVLAVLLRYDGSLGLSYGANICARVTRDLMTPR